MLRGQVLAVGLGLRAGVAVGEPIQNADDKTVKGRLDYVVRKLIKKVPK